MNFDNVVILAEGQRVYFYDELVQLAKQDIYKDKEFIEVVLLTLVEGG